MPTTVHGKINGQSEQNNWSKWTKVFIQLVQLPDLKEVFNSSIIKMAKKNNKKNNNKAFYGTSR